MALSFCSVISSCPFETHLALGKSDGLGLAFTAL
jgi:hypothetical protein